MSELHELMSGHEQALMETVTGAQLDELTTARLRLDVRRRQRATAWRTAAVSASLAGIVGLGAYYGADVLSGRGEPVGSTPSGSPVVSVSPSPTPEASSTASPIPEEAEVAIEDLGFAGGLATSTYLPTAGALTLEAWETAGPGWVLAAYKEQGYQVTGTTPQVVYLVSPNGIRYEVAELPALPVVDLVAWAPGETYATASVRSEASWRSSDDEQAILDLTTGHIERLGTRVGDSPEVAATEVNVAGYSNFNCTERGAFENGDALVACTRPWPEGHDESWLWSNEGWRSEPTLLRLGGNQAHVLKVFGEQDGAIGYPGATVVNDLVVFTSADWGISGCHNGRYVLRAGRKSEPLAGSAMSTHPSPNIYRAVGDVGTATYTIVTSGCSGDVAPETLVRDDLATGVGVELIPFPAHVLETDVWISTSLNGYVIVE